MLLRQESTKGNHASNSFSELARIENLTDTQMRKKYFQKFLRAHEKFQQALLSDKATKHITKCSPLS